MQHPVDTVIRPLADAAAPVAGGTAGYDDKRLSHAVGDLEAALGLLRRAEQRLHARAEELDRAREAAEAERQRFADLFGLYPAAYLKTTPTGVIQEANQAAATLLGDASPAALVGQSLALFVAEEDRDAFLSQLESLPERGRVADWRVRVTGHGDEAHGVPIPVTVTVAALRDEGGRTVSLRWFVRDQSERRQAEEERYRMLVEEVTDYAMFLLDKAGHIVSWNNGAKRLLDYEPAEIIGRHWTRVFTPEDLAAGVPEWEFNTATAEGRAEDERWHVKKDGSRFWASGILTALRGPDDHSDDAEADAGADAADAAPDPAARQQRPGVQPTPRERAEVRFYAKVLRDMTARKELLDRLQASEERLRTVVSNAPVILFALDGLGVFTLAEGRGLAALGLAPQDLVGHSVFEVWAPSGATPAGEATLLDDVRRALEGETFASVREVAGQVLEIWYAPLRSRDSGEQPLLAGVIGVATDVTERLRAEAALRRAHDELEGRVLKRTSELALANAARRELLRKLVAAQEEERRRLSRELHDQMGQHLAALSVNLRTLGDVLVPHAQAHDLLQTLQQIAEELSREAHHLAGQLRPVALDDLGLPAALRHYVEEWSARTGIAAQFRCAADPDEAGRLPAPLETTLYRIVQEALTNVVKHAQGVTRVSVLLQRSEDQALAIVEDDGAGFDAHEALSAVAASAVRAEPHLGLLNMQERAALLGGTVSVESFPGRGTAVFARVPLATDDRSAETL